MNVEIGDTGKYGFFEGHTSIIYSLIFHGKSKIFYGKFAACSCDAAWRDAHLGDRMCSSVNVLVAGRYLTDMRLAMRHHVIVRTEQV